MGIAAKSPNDGYTLVIGDLGSLVIAPLSKPGIGYDPQKDLAPISLVSAVSIVVTANPKSPDNSIAGLPRAREGAARQADLRAPAASAARAISRSNCCAR